MGRIQSEIQVCVSAHVEENVSHASTSVTALHNLLSDIRLFRIAPGSMEMFQSPNLRDMLRYE